MDNGAICSSKRPIFLSASTPDRHPYTGRSDPLLVREAILGLVTTALRDRTLVFGGHPAISPLVDIASRSLGAVDKVVIYQSEFFANVIPPIAKLFPNLRWTQPANDRAKSLTIMREQMISSFDFSAMVIVGGMEGIEEELTIFQKYHANSIVLPLASTGAAAADVWDRLKPNLPNPMRDDLQSELRYAKLFRSHLPRT